MEYPKTPDAANRVLPDAHRFRAETGRTVISLESEPQDARRILEELEKEVTV